MGWARRRWSQGIFGEQRSKALALVFAKLVSLTQTFDSLGSINASRHVASRKEQGPRTRVRYVSTQRNDSYKLPSLYSSRILFQANRSRRKDRPIKPGNEIEILFRRLGEKCRDEKRLTAKAALPFTDSCSRTFIKLDSTSTYTSSLRVLLMFREGEVERSKDRLL